MTHHQESTPDAQTKTSIQHHTLVLCNVDYVSSNAKSSRFGAKLYIWEDNEAVIKMIIKGRSPTMRLVSRTHRVALDWLCDRINLDPKIEIKYIDTKHEPADILTKWDFTHDEWNNLLHLFNISPFSLIRRSQNFSSTSSPETMAKRTQEEKREERIVAKSNPTLNMVTHAVTSSSTVQSSTVAEKSGDTQGTLSTWLEKNRETCSERTQSRRSVEFSSVAKRCNFGREYEETRSGREEPRTLDFPWKSKEYEETLRFRKLGHRQYWQNFGHIISKKLQTAYRTRRRFSRMWDKDTGLSPGDNMEHLYVNAAIWEYLCPSLFKLQFILGKIFR